MELDRVSIRKVSIAWLGVAGSIASRVKQMEQCVRKADQEESKDQEEPDDPSRDIEDDVDDNSELLDDSKLEQLYVVTSMGCNKCLILVIDHSAAVHGGCQRKAHRLTYNIYVQAQDRETHHPDLLRTDVFLPIDIDCAFLFLSVQEQETSNHRADIGGQVQVVVGRPVKQSRRRQ